MIQRLCQGIEIVAHVGVSLSAFLADVMQVDKDFIENELPIIFRDDITCSHSDDPVERKKGTATIKLFNTMAPLLGPRLIKISGSFFQH